MADTEKDNTTQSAMDAQHEIEDHTKGSSIFEEDEPVPHLHAKTYLTVFAVCLIYFAQLINVVGAGAVSYMSSMNFNYLTQDSVLKILALSSGTRTNPSGLPPLSPFSQSSSPHLSHKLLITGGDDGS